MSTIRLAVNQDLENVFKLLEQEYKPMSRAEILKMVLAKAYNKILKKNRPFLTLEQEKELAASYKDYYDGNYTTLNNDKEIEQYVESLTK